MKKIITLLFSLSIAVSTAQEIPNISPKNNIKLELLGNGLFSSIKYQRTMLAEENYTMNFGFGFGFIPYIEHYNDYFGPLINFDLNFVFFKEKHHLVTGLGYTQLFLYSNYDKGTMSNSNLRFSYLYRKQKGGINFSTGVVPLFSIKEMEDIRLFEDRIVLLTIEISLGYSF